MTYLHGDSRGPFTLEATPQPSHLSLVTAPFAVEAAHVPLATPVLNAASAQAAGALNQPS